MEGLDSEVRVESFDPSFACLHRAARSSFSIVPVSLPIEQRRLESFYQKLVSSYLQFFYNTLHHRLLVTVDCISSDTIQWESMHSKVSSGNVHLKSL